MDDPVFCDDFILFLLGPCHLRHDFKAVFPDLHRLVGIADILFGDEVLRLFDRVEFLASVVGL